MLLLQGNKLIAMPAEPVEFDVCQEVDGREILNERLVHSHPLETTRQTITLMTTLTSDNENQQEEILQAISHADGQGEPVFLVFQGTESEEQGLAIAAGRRGRRRLDLDIYVQAPDDGSLDFDVVD